MQDTQNNNAQQTPFGEATPKILLNDSMLDLFRQSINARLETLAFDANEPHELCYQRPNALATANNLQQVKTRLQLLSKDITFLCNEIKLLEGLQNLTG